MGFVFDAGYSEEELNTGGSKPAPGFHGAALVGVIENEYPENGNPYLELQFEVVTSKDSQQVGKKITQRLYCQGSDAEKTKSLQKRVLVFAEKLGLVTKKQILENERLALDFQDAVGNACVIEVKSRKYKDDDGNDKETVEIPWTGIYKTTDPEAKKAGINGGGASTPPPVQETQPAAASYDNI